MFKNGKNTNLIIKITIGFSLLCLFAWIFALIFCDKANAVYSTQLNNFNINKTLCCDSSGVYAIGFNSHTSTVSKLITNSNEVRTLSFEGNIRYATVNNGCIYTLSVHNNDIIINKYVYDYDSIYSYNLGQVAINSSYKFYVSGDRVYFAEDDEYSCFSCYSIYGEKLYSFNSIEEAIDYTTNINGDIFYIFSKNSVYTVNTNNNTQPQYIATTPNLYPSVFVCDNTAFDYDGNIIDFNNNTAISTGIITGDKINAGIINGYYCKYSNGIIYGYDSNGNKNILYKTNFNCSVQMCSFDNKLYLLSEYGDVLIIADNELTYPQNNSNSNTNSVNNTPNTSDNNNEQNNTNATTEFNINSYKVDTNKNIIWDISTGTTIAQLKHNITYTGYELEFYNKNNKKKTNGKVGTNFTMIIKENGTEYNRYTLSVKGDLSGEGNVNSNDVEQMSIFLMNGTTFTDEQYTAGDINNDGVLNGVDLLKIARNNL